MTSFFIKFDLAVAVTLQLFLPPKMPFFNCPAPCQKTPDLDFTCSRFRVKTDFWKKCTWKTPPTTNKVTKDCLYLFCSLTHTLHLLKHKLFNHSYYFYSLWRIDYVIKDKIQMIDISGRLGCLWPGSWAPLSRNGLSTILQGQKAFLDYF